MTHSVQLPAPLQYPHVQGVRDPRPFVEVARESKIHRAEDSPKPAVDSQQLLVIERKKLVLVGMDLRRHMVDMFV